MDKTTYTRMTLILLHLQENKHKQPERFFKHKKTPELRGVSLSDEEARPGSEDIRPCIRHEREPS